MKTTNRTNYYTKLQYILKQYNQAIRKQFDDIWKGKEKLSYDIINMSRDSFIKYCKDNNLNYSSIGGTILEWTFFHFLNAGLSYFSKDKIAQVESNCKITARWKKKGNKYTKLDIVIKNRKNAKVLYTAYEIKTNFEDGFSKYITERKALCKKYKIKFPNFKYYYICLNGPGKNTKNVTKKKINKLIKIKHELYILKPNSFNNNKKADINVLNFYKAIKQQIRSIE